ncbi:MAG: FlgD immunoglobulin-like domain containing protein [bacterium]
MLETADGSANDVGSYTSLALDASGNPHVSYFDATTFNLKYARKSGGVWAIETADGSANQVGYYASLALDALGNPHVSYLDNTTGDVKYARKSGGVWTLETADGSANVVGWYTSLALDASGNPHVSYQDGTIFDLKYARKSGGVWTIETADGSANNVGEYTSLALDASGNPHVSYLDGTTFDVKYARKSGGVWTIETADGSANSVGWYTSLALDASGNPHVSYHDPTTGDLKYARKSGGVWTIETADGSANFVGEYTSLALDALGNPHVSYLDASTNDLYYTSAAVRVLSPNAAVTWAVGSLQNIDWSGIGPVDIAIAPDGSGEGITLLNGITTSPIALRVPHLPSRFARILIERAAPFSADASDSFFRIDASITLQKFDATLASAADAGEVSRAGAGTLSPESAVSGVRLAWQTSPGLPELAGYRLESARDASSAFTPLHGGVLESEQHLDPAGSESSRYRLFAVNGLGEEYLLGETSLATTLSAGRLLAVAPNPAPGGSTRVAFRVPVHGADVQVSVFDVSGRRIRTLASGPHAAGVRTSDWDGRDDGGRDVAGGVYFVRLGRGEITEATERVVVVR